LTNNFNPPQLFLPLVDVRGRRIEADEIVTMLQEVRVFLTVIM